MDDAPATPAKLGIRALLIDDDAFMSGFYRSGLVNNGLDVTAVFSGSEGLKKAAELRPDIILLDLLMPQMDGFETLGRLKADPQTKDIPVIILSTVSESPDIQRAMNIGARAFFIKAQTLPAEAVTKIREILGR